MKGSLLQKPVDVTRKFRLCRKMCLDLTVSGLKTLRQVSLYLSDLEMNLTAIVPHLLLAPANTVVKPADHEFVRRPSLLLVS